MGNRSYLYLEGGSAGARDQFEIAEANNNFPVLWQLMLAGGAAGEAIVDQRAFGDGGTGNLVADADTALSRCRQLAAFVHRHPLLPALPSLALQFDGLVAWLEEMIELARDDDEPVSLSANLDELFLMEDGSPAGFLAAMGRECDERWARVQACMAASSFTAFDAALDVPRFADRDMWSWGVGLGGLSHDYFDGYREPPATSYAEFVSAEGGRERDDDDDDDAPPPDDARPVADGLWRWRDEHGRVGLRRADGGVAAAAAWSDLAAAAAPGGATFWAWRDGRAGLLRVDAQGEHLVAEPAFAQVWNFEHGVATVALGDDAPLGLIAPDGRWLIPPTFDEVWDEAHGFARVRVGERVGFVDRAGAWAFPAEWLEAGDFTVQGVAPVRTVSGWGLVRADGAWACEPAWDELTPAEDGAGGWTAVRHGRRGLLDTRGAMLVPCEYDAYESFPPTNPELGVYFDAPGVLRTTRDGVHGLFDVAAGRELLPCRHAWLSLTGWGGAHAWLVADPVSPGADEMRMGVLRADGSVLFSQDYAWMATRLLGRDDFGFMLVFQLHKAWSEGRPVQAVRNDSGAYAWLHADGREQSHADHMRERRAAGDRQAAEEFARHLRDGEGVGQDPAEARAWFAFAAGVPDGGDVADPAKAHQAGRVSAMHALAVLLRRGDGGAADPAAALAWLELARRRGGRDDASVNFELAWMLRQGLGAAADPVRARRLYGVAAARDDGPALYNRGLMCMEGEGGPVDADEAIRCFRKGDELGRRDASFRLGVMLARHAGEKPEPPDSAPWHESAYFLRKAAEDDAAPLNADASYHLGRLFMHALLGDDGMRHAEPWLLRAFELAADDPSLRQEAAGKLADIVYGHQGSPLHDAGKARHWRQVRASVASENGAGGPPDLGDIAGGVTRLLGRLFGRRPPR